MKEIYVKPYKGQTVINPATRRALPESGAWVPNNGHWARRRQAGEVYESSPSKKNQGAKSNGGDS